MRNFKLKFISSLRYASTKVSPFSDTVLLPKTNFPAKVTANVILQEKVIQKNNKFDDLYEWQRQNNNGESFILHDGPPYANGDVHVGHALNKILKDITNRYKMLRGYRVHYVPGWDCHGLPIEIKAIKAKDHHSLDQIAIRKAAQKFAAKTISKQRDVFQRWGIMADWRDAGCYFTDTKGFEAIELEAFHQIFKKGLIYRDLKPVYWSPSSRTALAEAELEYNVEHMSRSIYVSFPLKDVPDFLKKVVSDHFLMHLHVLVWTTQPWTIPANQAVCYAPNERYCLVSSNNEKSYILAESQLANVEKMLGIRLKVLFTFEGKNLQNLECFHPMNDSLTTPLLPSSHVTMDKGTGFVHVAPAHGAEDFALAIQHGLDVKSEVDDDGKFTEEAGYNLKGKFIFSDGNEAVIEKIYKNNNLVHEHNYTHSFPYDWRTKKPIFVKTSRQWFVDTNALRNKATDLLDDVTIIPNSGRASMMSQLKGRTFWCISRQRAWGVPIPVFYRKHKGESLLSENNEMLLTDASVKHVISVIKENGSDVWWELPISTLLPQSVIDEAGFSDCSSDDFEKGKDILDIWFDSGLTWAAVLGEGNGQNLSNVPVADLYLEGKDQYGGWFQSSLMTSCAVRDMAPYKSLLVHGFVMSESGQKMSKSLGNVVDPVVVTDGGKNLNKDPAYGADVLRLWVAESNVYQEVAIGKKILHSTKDSLNKIRLCFRFLLGNLKGYDPEKHNIAIENMWNADRYILLLLHKYSSEVTQAYDNYDYGKVTRLFLNLITKLSNFYFTIIKDRLYCDEEHNHHRISCQTTIYHILNILSKTSAPILPHTMEEVIMHHPCTKFESVFKHGWLDVDDEWKNEKLRDDFIHLSNIRDIFVSNLDSKQPAVHDVDLRVTNGSLFDILKNMQPANDTSPFSQLRELLGCSKCKITMVNDFEYSPLTYQSEIGNCSIIVQEAAMQRCQRCRLYTAEKATYPCERCAHVIAGPWAA